MSLKLTKNKVILIFSFLIIGVTLSIIEYKNSVYNSNKELFEKTIFQEAKTHFENLEVYRTWNSLHGGTYIRSNGEIKPNEFLVDNKLLSKNDEELIKVSHAWMTNKVAELLSKDSNYSYNITSLKPLNPKNRVNKFEKEALEYFEKNEDKHYFKIDEKTNSYHFMGRLDIEVSCLECHAVQGYNIGDLKGGIRVTIPASIYQAKLESLIGHHKTEIAIIVISAMLLFIIVFYIVESIYKSQEKLKELSDKYKILNARFDYAVSGSKLGIWDWDIKSDKVYFSKEWKSMLGFEENELENHLSVWDKLVHPDDKQKAYDDINANQKRETKYYENIHRLKHKDGSWVWILDRGKTIFDENGNAIRMIGSHTNITQIKKLEEELKDKEDLLVAQSRHAAMGEMISMIAHQWRQPVAVVEMAANNILVDLELGMVDEEDLKDTASSIVDQTEYLSQTIEDFRDFFRPNKEKEIINPKDVVDETLKIVGKSLENNNVNVIFDIKDEYKVEVFSRELLQVFINIVKNAKEAFSDKGIKDQKIKISIFEKDELIRIEFYNNAGFIEEDIISKIFEPYFSTKNEKMGTGLGLYMSKTIIEKHLGGILGVVNVDEGVCFYIELDKYKV